MHINGRQGVVQQVDAFVLYIGGSEEVTGGDCYVGLGLDVLVYCEGGLRRVIGDSVELVVD